MQGIESAVIIPGTCSLTYVYQGLGNYCDDCACPQLPSAEFMCMTCAGINQAKHYEIYMAAE